MGVGPEGVEPSTSSMSTKRSTAEPRALKLEFLFTWEFYLGVGLPSTCLLLCGVALSATLTTLSVVGVEGVEPSTSSL